MQCFPCWLHVSLSCERFGHQYCDKSTPTLPCMPVTVQQTMAARSCRQQESWQLGAPAAGAELLCLGAAQSLFQPCSLLLSHSVFVPSPPDATSSLTASLYPSLSFPHPPSLPWAVGAVLWSQQCCSGFVSHFCMVSHIL